MQFVGVSFGWTELVALRIGSRGSDESDLGGANLIGARTNGIVQLRSMVTRIGLGVAWLKLMWARVGSTRCVVEQGA